MEYMMRRSHKSYVDVSRLFLYKATRKLLGWTGDTGAYLRSTMQAAAVFGVPPERYWPYEIGRFEDEPDAFLYAFASSYQALNYVRLDATGQSGADTLGKVKQMLAKGFVAVFGFPVYSSLVGSAPDIPYPTDSDSLVGGHAVLTVGYDDGRQVGGVAVPSLIIRNSWGESWGEAGYGYLPYRYVEDELAADFWTIFKEDWIDPARFG
jgi:C1A family cysteine protease